MPESFIGLPADSIGKKMRTRQRTISANTVEEQYVAFGAEPTYMIWAPSQACAANKLFLSILNNAGSNQVLRVRKLFLANSALAAVAGVGIEFQCKRISAIVGGTAITPNPSDTSDGALSNTTVVYGNTATEGVTLFSWYTNNDEIGLTGGFPQATIQALTSVLPEGPEIRELTLNPGEGFCWKQITSSAIGSFGVLAVITRST